MLTHPTPAPYHTAYPSQPTPSHQIAASPDCRRRQTSPLTCRPSPVTRRPPPAARRDASILDNYHGVSIADPYRWLKDPDAMEMKQFVSALTAVTNSVLADYHQRDQICQRITALFGHPHYDTPYKRGNYYFYSHNTGFQPQSVMYVQTNLEGEVEMMLDLNVLSEDGTVVLSSAVVSKDGRYLAYGLS